MPDVLVDKNKIDLLANAIADKSGEPVTMTLDEMVDAVDGIDTSGGVTPTGNINITQAGTTDVTNYAVATVPSALQFASTNWQFVTENNAREWKMTSLTIVDPEEGCRAGWIDEGVYTGVTQTFYAVPSGTTITPTESSQTIGGANVMMEGAVTVNPIPSQYIIPTGNLPITQNGNNIDVAQYATVSVNVSGGSLTVATKTLTNAAITQTLSFSSLSGEPKYWFLRATTNISSSGSTTYYYITDLFYDGTNIKGNTFRIGSTRRVQNITSGVTQSFSNNTLTITAGSVSTATPGQFYGTTSFGYELVYVY